MNITEGDGQRTITGTVDELRGVLLPAEIAELEKLVAEVQDAASSPQKARRWEREARRREAEQRAVLAAYQRMRAGHEIP